MKTIGLWAALAAAGLLTAGCHRTKDMDGKVVQVAGSYAKTCRSVADLPGGLMSASCKDAKGQFHTTTVQSSACHGDLANMNGELVCPGAPPPTH